MLIFLAGEQEVISAAQMATNISKDFHWPFHIVRLFGQNQTMASAEIEDKNRNNVSCIICATNVAESGVTIENLFVVIDSCEEKRLVYNTSSMCSALEKTRISKSSLLQRLGRIGRTRTGHYYPYVNEAEYEEMPEYREPELSTFEVIDPILFLINCRHSAPSRYGDLRVEDLPAKMDLCSVRQAVRYLFAIGAIHRLPSQDINGNPCQTCWLPSDMEILLNSLPMTVRSAYACFVSSQWIDPVFMMVFAEISQSAVSKQNNVTEQ
jgi:HrpA-like RNA helicase